MKKYVVDFPPELNSEYNNLVNELNVLRESGARALYRARSARARVAAQNARRTCSVQVRATSGPVKTRIVIRCPSLGKFLVATISRLVDLSSRTL